jgi:hypothetical protein
MKRMEGSKVRRQEAKRSLRVSVQRAFAPDPARVLAALIALLTTTRPERDRARGARYG